MLAIEQLTKRFGDKTAVDRASFVADKPAMIGITGRVGARKASLLRLLNRLAEAS